MDDWRLRHPLQQGLKCSEVEPVRWGGVTKHRLPGGGKIGLYQPKHLTALTSPSSAHQITGKTLTAKLAPATASRPLNYNLRHRRFT
jgi:hypothetical protein